MPTLANLLASLVPERMRIGPEVTHQYRLHSLFRVFSVSFQSILNSFVASLSFSQRNFRIIVSISRAEVALWGSIQTANSWPFIRNPKP